MPKKPIRVDMLARRKHLAAEICLSHSLRIQERFLAMAVYRDAGTLALYSPILNEVFTEEIFHCARREGKKLAFPRVQGEDLVFVEVASRRELMPGSFGVLEPGGQDLVPASELDVLLVPGVAFDLCGHRLGYGKGFYDRALGRQGRPRQVIGLCYELQLVQRLPAEEHDVCLDLLVTEERCYAFGPAVAALDSCQH